LEERNRATEVCHIRILPRTNAKAPASTCLDI